MGAVKLHYTQSLFVSTTCPKQWHNFATGLRATSLSLRSMRGSPLHKATSSQHAHPRMPELWMWCKSGSFRLPLIALWTILQVNRLDSLESPNTLRSFVKENPEPTVFCCLTVAHFICLANPNIHGQQVPPLSPATLSHGNGLPPLLLSVRIQGTGRGKKPS